MEWQSYLESFVLNYVDLSRNVNKENGLYKFLRQAKPKIQKHSWNNNKKFMISIICSTHL